MASLANIDQRISTKRRELADAVSARTELFDKIDACIAAIESIEASENQEGLDAKVAEHKQLKADLVAKSDVVRKLEADVSDLEDEKALRIEHNTQAANLGKSQPRNVTNSEDAQASNVTVKEATKEQQEHDIICCFRNAYIARREGLSLRAVTAGEAGDMYRNDRLSAAMSKSNNANIIPENYRPVLIEMLRANTVVRKMEGLTQLPLLNGNLRIPRQATGSTMYYQTAELANMTPSDATTDEITLSEKKGYVMVVSSGDLWRHASPAADAMIRQDIQRQVGLGEDTTFLRNTANTTYTPKGLKFFCETDSNAGRIFANQTVNLANVTADLGKLILKLEDNNIPILNGYFLIAPRTERYLMDLRDGNGNYAFPEMMRGQLRGYPYLKTTSIPTNLTVNPGSGNVTECSEVYFVAANELIIADSPLFDISISTEAAYWDGSAVQAAFSQDAVLFRAMVGHDTAIRHNRGVAMLSAVIWGK